MTDTTKKMNHHQKNALKLVFLLVLTLVAVGFYLMIGSHPENPKLFKYILSLRVPTLICMVIASISIGVSTLIF